MDISTTILRLLSDRPEGISISEISEQTAHTRATIAKYLEVLKIKGKVKVREVGRTKLWSQSDKKKTILIAEDEAYIRRLIKVVLRSEDHEFLEAKDGLEALEIVSETMPDLIILDIMMPNIDGIKVCSQLKKNPLTKKIPIIMLTAKREMADKVIGVKVGADDYLTKPFEPRELRTRANSFLDTKQKERNPVTNLLYYRYALKKWQDLDERFNLYYLYFSHLEDYKNMYGLSKTNELIRLSTQLIVHILEKSPIDFLITHDDTHNFLLGIRYKHAEDVLKEVQREFELAKPFFYNIDLQYTDKKLNFVKKRRGDDIETVHIVELHVHKMNKEDLIPSLNFTNIKN